MVAIGRVLRLLPGLLLCLGAWAPIASWAISAEGLQALLLDDNQRVVVIDIRKRSQY